MTTSFVASRTHVSLESDENSDVTEGKAEPKISGHWNRSAWRSKTSYGPLRPCYQFVPAIWRRIRSNKEKIFSPQLFAVQVALQLRIWTLWLREQHWLMSVNFMHTNAVAGFVSRRCNIAIAIYCRQMKTKIGREGDGLMKIITWIALFWHSL